MKKLFFGIFIILATQGLASDTSSECTQITASMRLRLALPQDPTRNVAVEKAVETFFALLDEAGNTVDKESILRTIKEGDPFLIRGTGRLGTETTAAFAKLETFVRNHKNRRAILTALRAELIARQANAEKSKKKTKKVIKKKGRKPLTALTRIEDTPEHIMGLDISPDGKRLVAVGHKGDFSLYGVHKRNAKLIETGAPHEQVGKLHEMEARNRWVAKHKKHMTVREPLLNNFGEWHNRLPYPVQFSPKSDSFAVNIPLSKRANLRLYSADSGRLLKDIRDSQRYAPRLRNTNHAREILFSPNGRHISLLGFGEESSDTIWNLRSDFLPFHYVPHRGAATSGFFTPDGHFHFTTGRAGSLRIFNMRNQHELVHENNVTRSTATVDCGLSCDHLHIAGHPTKKYFVTQWAPHSYENLAEPSESSARRWINSPDEIDFYTLSIVDYSKLPKSLSKEKWYLENGHRNFQETSWDLRSATTEFRHTVPITGTNQENKVDVRGLRFSPDGKYLVSYVRADTSDWMSEDFIRDPQALGHHIHFLDVFREGNWSKPLRQLYKYIPDPLIKFEFTPDGEYFITLDVQGVISVFRVNDKPKFRFLGTLGVDKAVLNGEWYPNDFVFYPHRIYNFAVSPDSQFLYVARGDGLYVTDFYE